MPGHRSHVPRRPLVPKQPARRRGQAADGRFLRSCWSCKLAWSRPQPIGARHDGGARRPAGVVSIIPATSGEVHAAQILAGATMALWIFVGLAPGLKAYATRIRIGVLVVYLLGFAGLAIYALVR